MKRWLWVLAYNASGNDKIEVAFCHLFVDAADATEAYAKGARLMKERRTFAADAGLNDYVVEIGDAT